MAGFTRQYHKAGNILKCNFVLKMILGIFKKQCESGKKLNLLVTYLILAECSTFASRSCVII